MNFPVKLDARIRYEPLSPQLMSADKLRLFALAILALKLTFALSAPPNGDESYYFLWGQHLQWSYRDHPPMVGWGTAVGAALFGWNYLGLRLATFVTAGATVVLFRLWARRLSPSNPDGYFWLMIGAYFASPLFLFTSTNVYPDHFLIFFVLAASYFLSDFLGSWHEGVENSYGKLYLAALCIGFAGLSKFNAIFFPLAFVGVLASDCRWRGLLRAPQLYLAGAIAVLIASPVFIWNAQHDFISFKWQFAGQFDPARQAAAGFAPWGFIQEAGAILYFGPFLTPALFRFLRAAPERGELGALQALGKWSFFLSGGFMLALALWAPASHGVKPYWSDSAFIPFVVVAPFYCLSPRMFKAHILSGLAVMALVTAIYGLNPLPMHWLGRPSHEATRYGWREIATEARRAMRETGADYIATPTYMLASLLSFGGGAEQDIMPVSDETDQFKLWRDVKALKGKTAIFILFGDLMRYPMSAPGFARLKPLRVVTARRFGLPVAEATIFLAYPDTGGAEKIASAPVSYAAW